ncbi:hypothetical protein RUND412_009539 [Rhizina undulata]
MLAGTLRSEALAVIASKVSNSDGALKIAWHPKASPKAKHELQLVIFPIDALKLALRRAGVRRLSVFKSQIWKAVEFGTTDAICLLEESVHFEKPPLSNAE